MTLKKIFIQNQKGGGWPARPQGLVVSSLSAVLRCQLPFLNFSTSMFSISIFRTGSHLLATSFIFLQLISTSAEGKAPQLKGFPHRKSSMMQRFEFGFDRKYYSADTRSYNAPTARPTSGNSYTLTGVTLDWVGSIIGSLMDQDDGFRFGDLVGGRLDQGPGKVESYYTAAPGSGDNEMKQSSTYYGRVDFSLGVQGAYRLKSGVDIGLRLYYELGQTFGTSKWFYDHTNKVVSAWVEYGRWVGEMQYGGNWNLSSKVYPTSKFKASLRWYTSENRKFFLGCNYERFSSNTVRTTDITGSDGVFVPLLHTEYKIQQSGFQVVGGFMF